MGKKREFETFQNEICKVHVWQLWITLQTTFLFPTSLLFVFCCFFCFKLLYVNCKWLVQMCAWVSTYCIIRENFTFAKWVCFLKLLLNFSNPSYLSVVFNSFEDCHRNFQCKSSLYRGPITCSSSSFSFLGLATNSILNDR